MDPRMNGFIRPTVSFIPEQLPADSSGIITMSSPSGSSDSGSPGGLFFETAIKHCSFRPTLATPGKNLNLMTMMTNAVQSETDASSMSSPEPVGMTVLSPKRSAPNEEKRQTTNLLFTQFQAQMSQMKTAMDALQSEIPHHKPPGRPRGRPPGSGRSRGSTRGSSVTYHSQISGSNGLKIKIKKSPGNPSRRGGHRGSRKRSKKRRDEDDDISDFEEEVYSRGKISFSDNEDICLTPSGWGQSLPEDILFKIFAHVVEVEGCIPFLVRASKVCRLWRKVASDKELWTSVDLASGRVKDMYRTERNLMYLLEHRFPFAQHLNIGGWSSALTNNSVEVIARCCTNIESLNMASCQKLSAVNVKSIVDACQSLKKLDLSAISAAYNTKSAVSPGAITDVAEVVGSRLTHLSLANNCLANCPQILTTLSENCCNLQTLDLSNVTSPRRDTIAIKIEQLQQGCQSLKILRLTNVEVILGDVAIKDQVTSPGFPLLEELSIAVDPKRCPGLDDSDLARIVKTSTKLRLLDVRGCSKISDSGIVRVPAWDLEHLYLSGCFATKSSSDGLELIVRKWRHSFQEIDFSWSPNEDAINLAITALSEIEDDKRPPVKVLDLCGSSVSFDSIKRTLRSCLNLQRLNLTSCRALPRGIKRNYQSLQEVLTLREQILSGKFEVNMND